MEPSRLVEQWRALEFWMKDPRKGQPLEYAGFGLSNQLRCMKSVDTCGDMAHWPSSAYDTHDGQTRL